VISLMQPRQGHGLPSVIVIANAARRRTMRWPERIAGHNDLTI
jgi:hypothetical protein